VPSKHKALSSNPSTTKKEEKILSSGPREELIVEAIKSDHLQVVHGISGSVV
jgi:hypothetical protein